MHHLEIFIMLVVFFPTINLEVGYTLPYLFCFPYCMMAKPASQVYNLYFFFADEVVVLSLSLLRS